MLLEMIRQAADRDTFLHTEWRVRDDGQHPELFDDWPLPLDADRVRELESGGNTSSDWSRVKISVGCDLRRIRGVRFDGHCLVGNLTGPAIEVLPGVRIEPCIEDVRLQDVLIGDGCVVRNVGMMVAVDAMRGAAIVNCGTVAGGPMNALGLEREIVFAPGTGGRQLPVFPGATSEMLAWLATHIGDERIQSEYRRICERARRRIRRSTLLVGKRAMLVDCRRVVRSAFGPAARAEGAESIEDTIALSCEESPTRFGAGVVVRQVTLSEGCSITDGAYVENAHFCEGAWAKMNAMVTSSILGPNAGVAAGECRSSFAGAFTAFNHQALLIATYWPGGRGNVSYGANVGSNHTGKAPDQEHWAGEGVFYGLGTCIKFPCNTMDAPYSIVATGVTMLPQKLRFPFSLVNAPDAAPAGLSPAILELTPGWMIESNLYGLLRSEDKFATRNHARNEFVETRVLRPGLLPLLADAIHRLESAAGKSAGSMPNGDGYLLEEHLPGAGKNFVREKSRVRALTCYRFAASLIAAKEILAEYERHACDGKGAFQLADLAPEMAAAMPILDACLTGAATWGEALGAALHVLEYALEIAERNLASDDRRGWRTIPDYGDVHPRPAGDSLMAKWRARLENVRGHATHVHLPEMRFL